jgi:hypothetical protein
MPQQVRTAVRRLLVLAAGVLLCVLAAGAEDVAGKVVSLTGQVSVLRDNQPWALNLGDAIQPRQIIVTGADSFAIFQLSDGSTFEIYSNSRVVFRDNPGNWRDLLDVLIGRIKVHIEKLGGQPNYNRIRTPTAVISVRGTTFNVDVEDEDATTLIMVEEGQVSVEHSLQPSGKPKVLNPGEWIRVFKNQPLEAKGVDKGAVMQGVFKAAAQAVYEAVYRNSRTPGSTGGTPGTVQPPGGPAPPPLPGDRDGGSPPPPPPPPKKK